MVLGRRRRRKLCMMEALVHRRGFVQLLVCKERLCWLLFMDVGHLLRLSPALLLNTLG